MDRGSHRESLYLHVGLRSSVMLVTQVRLNEAPCELLVSSLQLLLVGHITMGRKGSGMYLCNGSLGILIKAG